MEYVESKEGEGRDMNKGRGGRGRGGPLRGKGREGRRGKGLE